MALASRCTGVCSFDGPSTYCVACLRTLDEARGWKKMTDFKRHQIINDSTRRRRKVERPAAAVTIRHKRP